jgi:hypothetical protein
MAATEPIPGVPQKLRFPVVENSLVEVNVSKNL